MKRTIYSVLIFIIMIVGNIYSKDEYSVKFTDDMALETGNLVLSSKGDPLQYASLKVMDGNLESCVAGTGMVTFGVVFKKEIKVDKIVIYNGYQKNKILFFKNNRIKDIELKIYRMIDGKQVKVYTNKHRLDDTMGKQMINLGNTYTGYQFLYTTKSVYPGEKWDDTCLTEVELWYKGKKYRVSNIEYIKSILHKKTREYHRDIIRRTSGIHDAEILEDPDHLLERWKKLGVNTKEILFHRYKNSIDVQMEFKQKNDNWHAYEGSIMVLSKKRSYRTDREGFSYIKKGVKVGNWKIDKYGIVWIKVGHGKWKRKLRSDSSDTDLGKQGNY